MVKSIWWKLDKCLKLFVVELRKSFEGHSEDSERQIVRSSNFNKVLWKLYFDDEINTHAPSKARSFASPSLTTQNFTERKEYSKLQFKASFFS